jgi:cell division septum initiation protein DivIVA
MTQPDHEFRVVLRGYEPAEVDRVIAGLQARAAEAEAAVTALEGRVAETASSSATPAEPPTFEHLGDRVGQILALAEQEALEMRDRAAAETEGIRKLAEQSATEIRDAADHYADQRRRDAETEATRLLADAKRAADEERDAADRDAAAVRQEAEAIYEQQRADAAQAAADFETTLAERRERTAAEFRHQQAATQAQLDDMAQQLESARAAGQKEQESAEAQARRTLVEAEERAESIVREARAAADRVRNDSDRELAAATQRRDSINSQLTNVRQMLATLSGSATGFIVDPIPEDSVARDEVVEGGESVEGGDLEELLEESDEDPARDAAE